VIPSFRWEKTPDDIHGIDRGRGNIHRARTAGTFTRPSSARGKGQAVRESCEDLTLG